MGGNGGKTILVEPKDCSHLWFCLFSLYKHSVKSKAVGLCVVDYFSRENSQNKALHASSIHTDSISLSAVEAIGRKGQTGHHFFPPLNTHTPFTLFSLEIKCPVCAPLGTNNNAISKVTLRCV